MDEKELYIKDNEASRAELNEAINVLLREYASYSRGMDISNMSDGSRFLAARKGVDSLLDVLYGRLYLAECPF